MKGKKKEMRMLKKEPVMYLGTNLGCTQIIKIELTLPMSHDEEAGIAANSAP